MEIYCHLPAQAVNFNKLDRCGEAHLPLRPKWTNIAKRVKIGSTFQRAPFRKFRNLKGTGMHEVKSAIAVLGKSLLQSVLNLHAAKRKSTCQNLRGTCKILQVSHNQSPSDSKCFQIACIRIVFSSTGGRSKEASEVPEGQVTDKSQIGIDTSDVLSVESFLCRVFWVSRSSGPHFDSYVGSLSTKMFRCYILLGCQHLPG